MKSLKRLTLALVGALIAAIILLMLVFFRFSGARIEAPESPAAALPVSVTDSGEEQTRTLHTLLPGDFSHRRSILFKTTHTRVEVLVGEESVYRFGFEGNPSFLRSPGAIWHIVDLPQDSDGQPLTIRLSAVYADYYGNDPQIVHGSHAGCELALLVGSLPIVIIDCIILFAGIMCMLMHFVGLLRRRSTGRGRFLLIGLFSFSIAVWSLCQSGFLQFLIPDGPTLYFVDFFSFNLFPVPFNLFLAGICMQKRQKCMFGALAAAYLCDLALSCLLQFTGAADMFRLMVITHALMAVNVLCVFAGVHGEIRQGNGEMAVKFRLPLYIAVLFALCELIVYYIRDFRETSVFLPLGTIIFIVMLMWDLVAQYYSAILEEQKAAYFKKLASTDMLTGVMNRNAYENMLRRLERKEQEMPGTCVMLFDVDNLKLINDHYGHDKGDEALCRCCACIREAFGSDVECYRIGGDEFVCFTGRVDAPEPDAERFAGVVRRMAQQLDFPFSVSMGYAVYNPGQDRALRDVIRSSDDMMYRSKENKTAFVMPEDFCTPQAPFVEN